MKKIKPENYNQIIDFEQKRIFLKNSSRFVKESFVDFLLSHYPKNTKYDESEIFRAFGESKTFAEFLYKIHLPAEYDGFVKGGSLGAAEEEFYSLKDKYSL